MRFAVFVLGSLLLAYSAGAEMIDAKPGLWERTVTMQQQMAMPPMPDLGALTPAQRAQLERTMAAMSGKPTTSRECVTPEMLKEWKDFQKDPNQGSGDCTHEVLESSSKAVRMAVSCQDGATTGTMQFTASSPEKIDGTLDMVHRQDGVERPMKMTIASRWLGPECGDAAAQ